MAKRLIFEGALGPATVKAYWNHEDQEYSVRLWCGGKEHKAAKYFTSEKDDALGTASMMLTRNNCGRSFAGCRRRK